MPSGLAFFWAAIVLLACLLLAYLAGSAFGRRRFTEPPEMSVPVGSLFAMLGLILAFTFSTAWSRFEQRQALAFDEVNAIGTLNQRLDLMEGADARQVRDRLADYIAARRSFNRSLSMRREATDAEARSDETEDALWRIGVTATKRLAHPPDRSLVVQAMNEAFDIATARRVESHTHIPWLVAAVLALTSLLSAFVCGLDCAHRSKGHQRVTEAFLLCVAATVFTVFDLENARYGLIHVSSADISLGELQSKLGQQLQRPGQ